MDLSHCPHCASSQQGEKIAEKHLHYYNGLTHYSRTIGVNILGAYDGVLFWKCPDCNFAWQRWSEGTFQHARAIPHIESNNAHVP